MSVDGFILKSFTLDGVALEGVGLESYDTSDFGLENQKLRCRN